MSSPVAGAWEPVSDTHQGLWLFSETHYSAVITRKGRQRIEGREPTSDEIVEAYRDVNALSGTYTVSGSTVTFKRAANLRADVIGLDVVAEFTPPDTLPTFACYDYAVVGLAKKPQPLMRV